jgi:YD repeat-containing protein
VKTLTLPSGRVVSTNYDAAGRPQSVQGLLGGVTKTYASSMTYAPGGAPASMSLGNGLVETRKYNGRMQPAGVQAGSLLNLSYSYCPAGNCAQNDGNLQSQGIARQGTPQPWTQTYGYDGASRLTSVNETGPGTGWSETYGYDTVGNRWVASSPLTYTAETPFGASWYDANNRINNWSYDGSGNVTAVGGMPRTFAYDGENRQRSAVVNGVTTAYGYDGLGRRVTRTAASETTVFVYDTFGQLAAEYSTAAPAAGGTKYLTTDHLGSTRLVTDDTGSAAAMNCYDYLPFGGEGISGLNGRGTCFGTDVVRQKFTGKERMRCLAAFSRCCPPGLCFCNL